MGLRTPRNYDYRKIYRETYGDVPIDEDGRSYDIHHKDGDHTNSDPSNLIAIPIQEHYNIHYAQGDYGACWSISQRLKLTPEEISKLNSLFAKERVKDGTHHWLTDEHAKNVSERIARSVADGTYHMLGGKIQKESQLKRAKNKTHQWCGPKANLEKLKNGTHSSQKEFTCPHCNFHGKGSTKC